MANTKVPKPEKLGDSFAGTLEHRVLGDSDAPEAPPLFDVLLFAEDAGVVFAAGTTKIVALIAYRKVEMRDRRARVAIEQALAAPPDDAEAAVQPMEEVKRAVAKSPAKKTTAKKTVAKKAVAKKAVAKKTAARKTAAKKTVAKKPRTTKAPRKKTPA